HVAAAQLRGAGVSDRARELEPGHKVDVWKVVIGQQLHLRLHRHRENVTSAGPFVGSTLRMAALWTRARPTCSAARSSASSALSAWTATRTSCPSGSSIGMAMF